MPHAFQHPSSSALNVESDYLDLLTTPESQRSRVREETSLYLGLFSLTPLLLVLGSWSVLPVLVLAGFAIRAVHKMHLDDIEAIVLHVAAWTMVVLGMSILLLSPSLLKSGTLIPFAELFYSVSLSGVFILPLFALLALLYGARNPFMSVKQIIGMSAGFFHAFGWIVGFIILGVTRWNI